MEISLTLYSPNLPILIAWYPLLLEILGTGLKEAFFVVEEGGGAEQKCRPPWLAEYEKFKITLGKTS